MTHRLLDCGAVPLHTVFFTSIQVNNAWDTPLFLGGAQDIEPVCHEIPISSLPLQLFTNIQVNDSTCMLTHLLN